jgi:PEP-CTERM motif
MLLFFILASAAASVSAAPVRYTGIGTENPEEYVFTAAATGSLKAYFAGSTARFTNTLGLLVNGVESAISGLNTKKSKYGDVLNFGKVTKGDSLVFKINVLTTGDSYFSDKAMNSDNRNHIFSNDYAGDSKIPAGTYVAFEDKTVKNRTDWNYHDENFVFTNVATFIPQVPVPAAVWLFGSGLMGLVFSRKRKTL